MTLFEKSTSMQIIPFPAHYQLGYHNFDFSSFSRISCNVKVWFLRCKSMVFARQKPYFCNTEKWTFVRRCLLDGYELRYASITTGRCFVHYYMV